MIWRIRMLKDVGAHKEGDYVDATPKELEEAGLKQDEHFDVRGTHPQLVPSTLDMTTTAKKAAKK